MLFTRLPVLLLLVLALQACNGNSENSTSTGALNPITVQQFASTLNSNSVPQNTKISAQISSRQNIGVFSSITAGTITGAITNGVYNVNAYGADPTGTNDSSSAFATVWDLAKTYGGKVLVPPGTYQVYLDVSGCTSTTTGEPVVFEGYGTILVASPARKQNALIYGDNSGCPQHFSNLTPKFVGFYFNGTGLNYDVSVSGMPFESEHNNYGPAQVAGFYGFFVQYSRSLDDTFSAGTYSPTTTGFWVTGNSPAAEASNEVKLIRPRFNSNSIGANLSGGTSDLIEAPQVQNNSVYGIELSADAGGSANQSTTITNGYSEFAGGPVVYIPNGGAVNATINGFNNYTSSSKIPWLLANFAWNLSVQNVWSIEQPAIIADTSSRTGLASLIWKNNYNASTLNANPTMSFSPSLAVYLDISGNGGPDLSTDSSNEVSLTSGSNFTISGASIYLNVNNSTGGLYWKPANGGYYGAFTTDGPKGAFSAARYFTWPDAGNAYVGVIPNLAPGHAICETAAHTLGHCSTAIAANGTCACN